MAKRNAKLELSFRTPDGKRNKVELGGVFEGRFVGNYGVSLTLPTGEKNEKGYDEREKIVAVKTESGRALDITEAFVNLIVYEAMEARAPYDGPGADTAPAAAADEVNF